METKLLFPTPVWVEDDCGVDIDRIQNIKKKIKETDPNGRVASNDGGWQSWDFVPQVMEQKHMPLHDVYEYLTSIAYSACDDWGYQKYRLKMTNLWININQKGNFNHLHTHPGCQLSGVFYVKVPPCCSGELKFVRDMKDQCLKEAWGCSENFEHHEREYNNIERYVTPEENKALLFPAWLMHSVDRSASDDDRISLSFNFNVYSEHYVKNGIYPSQEPTRQTLPLSLM